MYELPPKMYFVINARMPNDKAYGIHIAKMCEAFIESGIDLTLVLPQTAALSQHRSLREFYQLRVDVPVRALVVPNWYTSGMIPFLVSSVIFSLRTVAFLRRRARRGEHALVYTVDMDTFSFALLPYGGFPVFAEMHGSKSRNILTHAFFRQVSLVIATNAEIKRSLQAVFGIPNNRILVEHNGVDFSNFQPRDRTAARADLLLPAVPIALYAGRFYDWKGLGILIDAAERTPEISWYVVGGTKEVFTRATGKVIIPSNVTIVPMVRQCTLPQWLAAADVLVIIGTAQNEHSFRNTAPMKLYENMAMRVPLVAAATPSLKSMLTDEVVFYTPDDVESLVREVRGVLTEDQSERIELAARAAAEHTWRARAARISGHFR